MSQSKKYYSLLVLDNNKWSIQFGDYEKEVVKDEQQDMKESYGAAYKSKIICTLDDQASIEAKVKELNS